ncbi:hypothetical protein BH09BAC4_BH09BAC4_02130 [soil metagenome]
MPKRPYWSYHVWSRGYFVNTIALVSRAGADPIRRYVQYQETEARKEENQTMDFDLFGLLMN